jgi:hypothetical protein
MNNGALQKIYVQNVDKEFDGEILRNYFNLKEYVDTSSDYSDLKEVEIVNIKQCTQFFVPSEY